MQKWEYKIIFRTRAWKDAARGEYFHWPSEWKVWYEDAKELPSPVDMAAKLRELGMQGWELVNVVPLASVIGAEAARMEPRDFAGYTTDEKWVFKRPIE